MHLLWAVPGALILSLPLWIYAGIAWCGVSGCTGGGFGISRGGAPNAVISLAISGFFMFLAFALVPWLRPLWARLVAALIIGIGFSALAVLLTGGPTPPEGCSRPEGVLVCEAGLLK